MPLPGLISLSDLIQSTADELRTIRSHPPAPGQAVMRFSACEIEVAAVASADADGKVKFWVIEAGADVKYENSQTVTLKFEATGDFVQALVAPEGVAPLPTGPKPPPKD
jgi:hypothetical protein